MDPMANNTEEKQEKLMIWGYLRDCISNENDYSFLILMVATYYHQGYAKYYDTRIDKEYEQKMKFGDIVRFGEYFQVINLQQKKEKVGQFVDFFGYII